MIFNLEKILTNTIMNYSKDTSLIVRIFSIVLVTIITFMIISRSNKNINNFFDFPKWYCSSYNISYLLLYLLLILIWLKAIKESKNKIHSTIDIMFESLLIFLFLSYISLWCLLDIKSARIYIILAAIVMFMIIIICFNINMSFGFISSIGMLLITYHVLLVFNIQKRRLNND